MSFDLIAFAPSDSREFANCNVTLAIDSLLDLALVFRAVEVSFRFRNEAVIVDLPKFVAADANALSCS